MVTADETDITAGGDGEPVARRGFGAYVVVVRGGRILLTQLSGRTTRPGAWTLPGGGIEQGEDPKDAVIREVREETGLALVLGPLLDVHSFHHRGTGPDGPREDYQSIRLVFDGSVAVDAPEPVVVEVDGTIQDAAWVQLSDVEDGSVETVEAVQIGLAAHRTAHPPPRRRQRLAAYAVLRREPDEILLTRISRHGHHPGAWTLPGGGVDHGEDPRNALVREVREETGLLVRPGRLLDVHSVHFTGRAPDGVAEDYHGVHLILAAELDDPSVQPGVVEVDGTADAVAWVPVRRIHAGGVEVLEVVRAALDCGTPRPAASVGSEVHTVGQRHVGHGEGQVG